MILIEAFNFGSPEDKNQFRRNAEKLFKDTPFNRDFYIVFDDSPPDPSGRRDVLIRVSQSTPEAHVRTTVINLLRRLGARLIDAGRIDYYDPIPPGA